MINAANHRLEYPKGHETLVQDNLFTENSPEAKQLLAESCLEYYRELSVLNSIKGLEGANDAISDNQHQNRPPVKQKQQRRKSRINNRRDETFASLIEVDGIWFETLNTEVQGIYELRFKRMVRQLRIASAKWKRVMCFRLDLHSKLATMGGKALKRFITELNRELGRVYGSRFKSVGYCWCLEVGKESKRKHYHLVLMVDGNLVQGCSVVSRIAINVWQEIKGQTAWLPENPYVYIERQNHPQHLEQIKAACKRMSYLAKSESKGFVAKGEQEFNCSRLKAA